MVLHGWLQLAVLLDVVAAVAHGANKQELDTSVYSFCLFLVSLFFILFTFFMFALCVQYVILIFSFGSCDLAMQHAKFTTRKCDCRGLI